MSRIDDRGNLHDHAGRFSAKVNSAPRGIALEAFRAQLEAEENDDLAQLRELIGASPESDTADDDDEARFIEPGPGDRCSYGADGVTHYRCDKYADGTVTSPKGGILQAAPEGAPIGFHRD